MQIADLLERADFVLKSIRERGPLTVAAFMDLALYDPEFGYYARTARRSGRAGDFFTSVDVGALFGELLEIQIAEMADILTTITAEPAEHAEPKDLNDSPASSPVRSFDLVEAGAGDGRLSADILTAARQRHPALYERTRLHLIELSAAARAAQPVALGAIQDRLATSSGGLPSSFEGAVIANELLDAMPVHQVVMREDGLREIYVDVETGAGGHASGRKREARSGREASASGGAAFASEGGRRATPKLIGGTNERRRGPPRERKESWLTTREGPPSTPALAEYLTRLNLSLESGWRVEINLRALDWVREAARRLTRGFIVLIDYGHEARELYSITHAGGTLTTFSGHTMAGPESTASAPRWLLQPGAQDITAHVDFTSVRAAAEAEGLVTLGFLDQTYFLLGLCSQGSQGSGETNLVNPLNPVNLLNPVNPVNPVNRENLKRRLALKTLLMPGGLGSTMKVMIFGKGVGTPALQGCSYRMRVT